MTDEVDGVIIRQEEVSKKIYLGLVGHAFNPSVRNAQAGGSL